MAYIIDRRKMAERLEQVPAHVLRGDGTLDVAAGMLREAADELTALRERVAELEGAIGIILGGKKSEAGTWMEMVEPLIARFDVAANFGGNAVHNPDGSAALAELIRQMGTRLDASVGVARAILSRPQQGGGDA